MLLICPSGFDFECDRQRRLRGNSHRSASQRFSWGQYRLLEDVVEIGEGYLVLHWRVFHMEDSQMLDVPQWKKTKGIFPNLTWLSTVLLHIHAVKKLVFNDLSLDLTPFYIKTQGNFCILLIYTEYTHFYSVVHLLPLLFYFPFFLYGGLLIWPLTSSNLFFMSCKHLCHYIVHWTWIFFYILKYVVLLQIASLLVSLLYYI